MYFPQQPGVYVPPVSGIPIPIVEEEVSEERKQRRKERKEAKDKKNKLDLSGNTDTMNLNDLIYNNILGSTYFKSLFSLKTYHQIIDEIYVSVFHLEPWKPNSKMASEAWCLLYKCFTIKLTKKQMTGMLDHKDSPYIRAIGFLYLRLCLNPRQIWGWFEPYLADEEEITVRHNGKPTTIGSFVEELLTSNKFVDTVLPRFPAVVSKEVNENLTEWQTQNPGVLRKPTYIAVDEKGTKRVRGSSTRRANNSRDRDRDRDRERGHKRSRSRSQERGSRDDRSRESKRVRSKSPEQTAPQKKTPSAEHTARMKVLAEKYGSSVANETAPEHKAPSATEKDTLVLGRRN